MRRGFVGTLIAFLWAICLVHAAPARLPYLPPEPPTLEAPYQLAGTTWRGKLYNEGEQIIFHANGTLTYGFGGPGESTGSWKLTGDQLYFEINKYSEYQTTLRGDIIQGKGWNRAGQQTVPILKRLR